MGFGARVDGLLTAGACAIALLASQSALSEGGNVEIKAFSLEKTELENYGIGKFPLEGEVESLLAQGGVPKGWRPSGAGRSLYLDLMEPIVRMAAGWVNAQGAVIDPCIKKEWAQTSPRFASSAAILLREGRIQDLKETVFKVMDHCCGKLPTPAAKSESPDFWMRELATAYICLKGVAPEERLENWKASLAKVEPEAIYREVDLSHAKLKKLHNWAVYSSSGESMRESAGIGGGSFLWGDGFFDVYMESQFAHITELGMYRDPNDPITYDITTRLQFASALAFGYKGPLRPALEEALRRGGLTTLLFVSPEGYVPYGGRSAQFNFQEAMTAALCELEARRYKSSNPELAGAFKRQAHLGVEQTRLWLEESPIRHIKNRFPPETQHGCDPYGQYSVYSLLASSFLGLAALYADDSIEERPAPSELGGYVLEVSPAFHKVFASCQGSYVEIDTEADPHYDATGIGRVLLKGIPPPLPLAAPFPAHPKIIMAKGSEAPEQPMALGPEWDEDGKPKRLAEWGAGCKRKLNVIAKGKELVEFEIVYVKGPLRISERIAVDAKGVRIRCAATRDGKPLEGLRYIVPVLESDGKLKAESTMSDGKAETAFQGAKVSVEHNCGAGELRKELFANRNGVYKALALTQAKGGEIELFIKGAPAAR